MIPLNIFTMPAKDSISTDKSLKNPTNQPSEDPAMEASYSTSVMATSSKPLLDSTTQVHLTLENPTRNPSHMPTEDPTTTSMDPFAMPPEDFYFFLSPLRNLWKILPNLQVMCQKWIIPPIALPPKTNLLLLPPGTYTFHIW
jgi:hypothetical protein